MKRDRDYAIGARGLLAAEAGVGIIDSDREKLLPLAGHPLGLPRPQSGDPLDLSPCGDSYLSEENVHKILRASRGALPAQLQIKVGSNLYALFFTPLHWEDEIRDLLPELEERDDFTSAILFIAFPIKNIESFMLKPEEAGLLAMPILESFHELARPIGLISMFLTKLRLDNDLKAELKRARPETWQEICFIDTMISSCLYPMIKHIGLIEKYGQLGVGEYSRQGYPLGASLKETIDRFLRSLKIARATPSFSDFGIPLEIFELGREIYEFQIPQADPLVEVPRSLLDTVATELTLNSLKHLPRDLEAYSQMEFGCPVRIEITDISDESFQLHFRNIHKPKLHIKSLRRFKHMVMSRPIGGLAGVNRLVRSVGWSLDFELRPVNDGNNDPIYYFDLTINGYHVSEPGDKHEQDAQVPHRRR